MASRLALVLIACMAFAGPATAGDFSRRGPYVGIGGGAAFDFLEELIEDNFGFIDITPGGAISAKAGYRLWSWFAVEAMYEGALNMGIDVDGVGTVAQTNLHSFVGNLKFILPIKRFQPYISIGPGAQYGDFWETQTNLGLSTTRWDFVLRTAVGLDFYITENWVVDLDLAPSIRFADYSDIPSEITDNVTLTTTVGVQYRF